MPTPSTFKLPRERKLDLLERLRPLIEEYTGVALGELGAENLLDELLRDLGPILYNQALHDARTLLNQRMVALEEDLFALEKPLKPIARK
jgi:uncharacterized protein (DUF2164 family)